jgi:hypothetical protein
MKILNPRSLPEAFVLAVQPKEGYVPNPNRIGVTSLIAPPHVRSLQREHDSEIEVDVEDMTWLIMGRSVHSLLEENSPKDVVAEQKIVFSFEGFDIVAVIDTYKGDVLQDFKVTSVYSFLLGEKAEWIQQLNIYAWMLKKVKDIDIKTLQIIAILRDFMPRKAKLDKNYPQKPLIAVDVPIWSIEKTEEFVRGRINAHKNNLPCTPEDRWARPTTFAVKAHNVKTAKKVCATMEEAEKWIIGNPKGASFFIEVRPGEDVRCDTYCNVSQWCEYYKNKKKEETNGEEKEENNG